MHALSHTHAHTQTEAQATVKICPSSVSEGFIQPCPSFLRFIIIPFFQSFNLKICSSSFFNNVQAREACPWEIMSSSLASRLDYIRGTGCDLEETPLFLYTISLDLPSVLISCFVTGDDLDEYDLNEREVQRD